MPMQNLSYPVLIRLTDTEAENLKRVAAEDSRTMAGFIRNLVRRELSKAATPVAEA